MKVHNNFVIISFFILILLNAADVSTTLIGLQNGGIETDEEALYLMNALGIVEALLLKFFLVVSIGTISIFFFLRSKLDYRLFVVTFWIANLYYIRLVINNSITLWRLLT